MFFQEIDRNEVLATLMKGVTSGQKYPPNVRKFCYGVYYHSPAAYEIVRRQFNNHLPHAHTLQTWLQLSDINSEAGINEDTLNKLRGIAKDLVGDMLLCSLLLDEIHIHKQVYFDNHKGEYVGYISYGKYDSDHWRKQQSGQQNESEQTDKTTRIRKKVLNRKAKTAKTVTKSRNNKSKKNAKTAQKRSNVAKSSKKGLAEDKKKKSKKQRKQKPKSPVASRALVFMLSGINKSFLFPVAYHFVNGLDAPDLAELVKEVVIKISECGIKICNLTFDGASENLSMCGILGANLNAQKDEFKPYIENPYDNSIIHIILCASHMEKLMRNLLGDHKVLIDETGKFIEWKYIDELEKVSRNGALLTHKLTKKHTEEYTRNRMKVRLAVETFSTSVADSIEMLRQRKHPKFIDSEPTIRFIRMMDKLFDIFNSRDPRHSNVYKRPINFENKREIFEFLEDCKVVLRSLRMFVTVKQKGVERVVVKNVLQTRNKVPVLGFLANMTNLPQMYVNYVEMNRSDPENQLMQPMQCFKTYALSQDHLEIFFGKIRSRNGCNDSPNTVQFKGAFRRLLANIYTKPPTTGNCMPFDWQNSQSIEPETNLYFVSSRRPKLDVLSSESFQNNLKQFEDDYSIDSLDGLGGLEILCDLQESKTNNYLVDGMADLSIAYAARLIEMKIETQEFYCDCCKYVFAQNDKMDGHSICLVESKIPCESTYYICKLADTFMNSFQPKCLGGRLRNVCDQDDINPKKIDFKVIFYKIMTNIDYQKVYKNTDFEDHESHKFHLVKCIVQQYIHLKTAQISKQITLGEHEKILRSKLTKWVHFLGQ